MRYGSAMACRSLVASLFVLVACSGDDGGRTSASGTGVDASTGGTGTGSSTSDGSSDGSTSGSGTSGTTGATSDATSGGESTSDTSTTGGAGGVPGALCDPIPLCDAVPPKLGGGVTPTDNNHRGRDMFYVEGDEQWVLAKFADGGVLDDDLQGETVHMFLLRGCEGEWEDLGTAVATNDGDHATVEGVEDTGGRIYFKIPEDKRLAPGRHRVHFIVESDQSTADQYIEVVPKGTPFFVSDVDGTLTTYETEEFWALLLGDVPAANPFAAQAMQLLVSKGYRPMYVTARPEALYKRTREFLDVHGFPHGLVHTTLTQTGALGGEATTYKTGELAMLADKGLVPTYVFGNTETDAEAYDNAGILPLENRIFFQFNDAIFGGRTIQSYGDLLDEFDALPDLCDP